MDYDSDFLKKIEALKSSMEKKQGVEKRVSDTEQVLKALVSKFSELEKAISKPAFAVSGGNNLDGIDAQLERLKENAENAIKDVKAFEARIEKLEEAIRNYQADGSMGAIKRINERSIENEKKLALLKASFQDAFEEFETMKNDMASFKKKTGNQKDGKKISGSKLQKSIDEAGSQPQSQPRTDNDADVYEEIPITLRQDFSSFLKDAFKDNSGLKAGKLEKFKSLFKRKESFSGQLKDMALRNLEKIRSAKADRTVIISSAHLLRDFLEIRLGINRELTYAELIHEIEVSSLGPEIKDSCSSFFRLIDSEEYSNVFGEIKSDDAYVLAKEIIEYVCSKPLYIEPKKD